MAHGDEAAAAGLSVFPATQDVRFGYENDNKRGDELARHMTDGTHPFTKITGTAATNQLANLAVTNAKIANNTIAMAKLARKFAGGTATLTNTGNTTINTGLGAGGFIPVLTAMNSNPEVEAYVVSINPANGTFVASLTGGASVTSVDVTWIAVQL